MDSNYIDKLWDCLKDDGYATIKDLVDNGVRESLHLEYKEFREKGDGNFKKHLGKALSAFSNSEGGILIFGIGEADPTHRELKPFEEYEKFSQRIRSILPQALSRPNNAVEVWPIEDKESRNSGFIAVKIPKSELRPHQVNIGGCKEYYRRADGESHVMLHYEIVDMLDVRKTPVLSVETHLPKKCTASRGKQVDELHGELHIRVVNTGVVPAKQFAVLVSDNQPLKPLRVHLAPVKTSSSQALLFSGFQHLLFPNMSAFALAFPIRAVMSNDFVDLMYLYLDSLDVNYCRDKEVANLPVFTVAENSPLSRHNIIITEAMVTEAYLQWDRESALMELSKKDRAKV